MTKILRLEVLTALATSKSAFRTSESLAKELNAPVAEIREILLSEEAVRRPVLARGEEEDYHRLVNRGLTSREQLRYALAVMSRTAR